MHPYRIAPMVEFYPKIPNPPNPNFYQRWKEPDGREFVIHDYILNSMTPWECYYPTALDGRTYFRRSNFDGCIFIGPVEESKI